MSGGWWPDLRFSAIWTVTNAVLGRAMEMPRPKEQTGSTVAMVPSRPRTGVGADWAQQTLLAYNRGYETVLESGDSSLPRPRFPRADFNLDPPSSALRSNVKAIYGDAGSLVSRAWPALRPPVARIERPPAYQSRYGASRGGGGGILSVPVVLAAGAVAFVAWRRARAKAAAK